MVRRRMIFMTSPLGRSVKLDDWRSFHADTILKLLFDVANSPFNPADDPLVLQSLENTTGMDRATVESICRVLEQHGLVELLPTSDNIEAARLTHLGRTTVWERLPAPSAIAGTSGMSLSIPIRCAFSMILDVPTIWLTRTAATFDDFIRARRNVMVPR